MLFLFILQQTSYKKIWSVPAGLYDVIFVFI